MTINNTTDTATNLASINNTSNANIQKLNPTNNEQSLQKHNQKQEAQGKQVDRTQIRLSDSISTNIKELISIESRDEHITQEQDVLKNILKSIEKISQVDEIKQKISEHTNQISDIIRHKEHKQTQDQHNLYRKLLAMDDIASDESIKGDISFRLDAINKEKQMRKTIKEAVISHTEKSISNEIELYQERSQNYSPEATYKPASEFKPDELTNMGYVMVALSNATSARSAKLLS